MPWHLQQFKKAPSYFLDTCSLRIKQLEKKHWKKQQKQTPQKRPIFNKKSKSHQGTRHWWAIPRFVVALWSESSPKNVSTLRSYLETWNCLLRMFVYSGILVPIKIPLKKHVHVSIYVTFGVNIHADVFLGFIASSFKPWNRGTLRIPFWEDWGTLGKIREITTPP